MEWIVLEYHDHVAVVKLNRGVTNALNPELVHTLAERLQDVKEDPQVRGLVLTSANDKFFSIGLDIPALYDLAVADFAAFYHTFNRTCMDLFTLPKPTIAAITGHAIAGGCILALCCDHRLIAAGRRLMGLNEVKLGVPVPYPADCILRQIAGDQVAEQIMVTGEFYAPEALLQMGLANEMLPLEQVRPRAVAEAQSLAALPPAQFWASKQARLATARSRIFPRLAEKELCFVERWYSPEARERLREAMGKF